MGTKERELLCEWIVGYLKFLNFRVPLPLDMTEDAELILKLIMLREMFSESCFRGKILLPVEVNVDAINLN